MMKIKKWFSRFSGVIIILSVITNTGYAVEQGVEHVSVFDESIKVVQHDGVVFKAKLLEPVAMPYEYMYMELTVMNGGSSVIEVAPICFDHGRFLDYELTDDNKQPICYMLLNSIWAPNYLIKLNPGESKTDYVCINNLLCWPVNEPLPVLSPGRYHISLKLKAFAIIDREKVDIELKINHMPFNVVTPTGDNALALELFKKGLSMYQDDDPEGANMWMQKVLQEYAETPYDVQAAQFLFHARKDSRQFLNKAEILKLRRNILMRHPDDPYNVDGNIQNLIALLSEAEMIDLYKMLKSKSAASVSVNYMAKKYPWINGESSR